MKVTINNLNKMTEGLYTIPILSVLTGEAPGTLYKRLKKFGHKKHYSLDELEDIEFHVKISGKIFIENYEVLDKFIRR